MSAFPRYIWDKNQLSHGYQIYQNHSIYSISTISPVFTDECHHDHQKVLVPLLRHRDKERVVEWGGGVEMDCPDRIAQVVGPLSCTLKGCGFDS